MTGLHTALWLAFALLALIQATGCSNESTRPDVGPAPIQYDRNTRDNLIAFFANAHNARDMGQYRESIHPEYVFVLDSDFPEAPPWCLDRISDLTSTGNMFGAANVRGITANFTNVTTDGDSGKWYVQYVPVGTDSLTIRLWATIRIDMHVLVGTDDGEVDYWVNGLAAVCVHPDPDDPNLWTVWRIDDLTGQLRKAESHAEGNWSHEKAERTVWAGLKAMFLW